MRVSDGRRWSRPGTLSSGNDFLSNTDTPILLEMIAAYSSEEGKGRPEIMLREEDQRKHTQDTGSADAAVFYRAGVALELVHT